MAALALVMFMQAEKRPMGTGSRHELGRLARIFAGDHARGLQNALGADGKILKIANRRADNIKNSSHLTIITNKRQNCAPLDSYKVVRVLLE